MYLPKLPGCTTPVRLRPILSVASMVLAIASASTGAGQTLVSLATQGVQQTADLSKPPLTGVLGHQDAAAIAEINANLTAVRSEVGSGIRASGTISFPLQGATAYNADYAILGRNSARLDIQLDFGSISTRVDNALAKVQSSTGELTVISPSTAAFEIFPFLYPQNAILRGKAGSLYDGGLVTVSGQVLHRVTAEVPAPGNNPVTKAHQTAAVDLYFDPATHLLVKTAALVQEGIGRPITYLSVVTYGDYRLVGNALIPFHFTETLNGAPYRELQLTTAVPDSTLSESYFEF